MAKAFSVGLGLVLGLVGCLGGTTAQAPVTPTGYLKQAQASADAFDWPAARESALAVWVSSCKKSISSADDCASAQLIRAQAELATDAPESALLLLDWVRKNGAATAQEKAQQEELRAKDALKKLLDERAAGMAWIVVEEDFDENHKFGPERAAFTLDGKPLGEVDGRRQFALREHRVLAQAIPAGKHRLAVEIHWKGQGTFDNYLWSSFTPVELEAFENAAVVASLDVTYNGGGPSNNSVNQTFRVWNLP